jgi:hypothetical protein
MRHFSDSRHPSLPAIVLLALATGCASNPGHAPQAANAVGAKCPAGTTLTCEARTTGRIHHGTFAKDNDRCACVRDYDDLPESPAIPTF